MSDAPLAIPDSNYDEDLVAYLDGELDAEEVERIEQRLSNDESYRQRLHHLQKTWDLLDDLPRAEASETFTQTTVSMIALRSKESAAGLKNLRTYALGLASVAAMLVAGLLGYGVIYKQYDAPNRQLLKDLPVIENLDLYQDADNIDFVRLLAKEGLFNEEASDEL